MGVESYIVRGSIKFEPEQQNTHMQLIIDAFSEEDAITKAQQIAPKVYWFHVILCTDDN